MNIDDRRIRRTRKVLREALAELIQKKELHSITVQELSDKADVHRATFYAHYKDIYDLYQQMEDSAVEELSAILVYDSSQTYEAIFQSLINYIYENQKVFQAFLLNPKFMNRIVAQAEKNYSVMWQDDLGDLVFSDEWIFLSRYHIQGCLAIITHWIETGYSRPKEEIIKLISSVDKCFDKFISSARGGINF